MSGFNSDFYAAAAGVLPLLVLAAAVEFRLFVISDRDVERWREEKSFGLQIGGNAVALLSYVLTVALGEWAALRALHDARTFPTTDPLVIGALLATAIVVSLAPIAAMLGAVVKEPGAPWASRAETVVGSALLMAVAAMPTFAVLQAVGLWSA